MDRFEKLLNKPKKSKPLGHVFKKPVTKPNPSPSVVYNGNSIESMGPSSQLFTLRSPNGFTLAIPLRFFEYKIEEDYFRSSSKLTINIATSALQKLCEGIEVKNG